MESVLSKIFINGVSRDMSHLDPFQMQADIDGQAVTLNFTFFNHCFTDEKGDIPMGFKNEERYWSEDRYRDSLNLRKLLEKNFLSHYAVVYLNKKRAEQYHVMEIHDYAIFFDINKPEHISNSLKIKIISAYTVDPWGKHALPKGTPKKVRWILSMRLKGLSALK